MRKRQRKREREKLFHGARTLDEVLDHAQTGQRHDVEDGRRFQVVRRLEEELDDAAQTLLPALVLIRDITSFSPSFSLAVVDSISFLSVSSRYCVIDLVPNSSSSGKKRSSRGMFYQLVWSHSAKKTSSYEPIQSIP